jgi:hypothetical protein
MTPSFCDCGRPKWYTAKRCIVCACADRKRENNPNWRGGPKPPYYYHKRTIDRHPEEARARANARNALRRGDIKRQPCEICGEVVAEMHHDDYAKPFQVRWLCRKHHRALHDGMGWQGVKKQTRPRVEPGPQELSDER